MYQQPQATQLQHFSSFPQVLSTYNFLKPYDSTKLFTGFVHNDNIKITMNIINQLSIFKLEQMIMYNQNGKHYEGSGKFMTWNLWKRRNRNINNGKREKLYDYRQNNNNNVNNNNNNVNNNNNNKQQQQQSQIHNIKPLPYQLLTQKSLIVGLTNKYLKLQYRHGVQYYKQFSYCPFINIQISKDFNQKNIEFGLYHIIQNLYFSTKLIKSIRKYNNFYNKICIQYCKDKIYTSNDIEIIPDLNPKININKLLLGYQMTKLNHFIINIKSSNIIQLFKGNIPLNKAQFYYLHFIPSKYIQYGIGAKIINSEQQTLNFIIQFKKIYQIKFKINTKCNFSFTWKKYINQWIKFQYGINVKDLWEKKKKIKTGIRILFNP